MSEVVHASEGSGSTESATGNRDIAGVPAPRDRFGRAFGPGILWAATAVGVSHLVQSTRAGADAGMALWWVILVALVVKYPFFEFGPRYAAATGRSLVEGYRRIGLWALWLFLLITIMSGVIAQTAVMLFTAVLVRYAFGLDSWPVLAAAAMVLGLCIAILVAGRFRALDLVSKVIMAALAISTLIAALAVSPRIEPATLAPWPSAGQGTVTFAFLLALVGWMPAGVDSAVWSSLWTLAKVGSARVHIRDVLFDFSFGYVGTGVLAFAFLALGAGVMYGSGTGFSDAGPRFAVQLVDLYASALGAWARPVVLVAAVTTMFSTALTLADGFPRAIGRAARVLAAGEAEAPAIEGNVYWTAIAVLGTATMFILWRFSGSLTGMLDFATTASFITAPIIGFLNLRAVLGPEVPAYARPSRAMVALAVTGLVLLGATAVVYLVML